MLLRWHANLGGPPLEAFELAGLPAEHQLSISLVYSICGNFKTGRSVSRASSAPASQENVRIAIAVANSSCVVRREGSFEVSSYLRAEELHLLAGAAPILQPAQLPDCLANLKHTLGWFPKCRTTKRSRLPGKIPSNP